MNDDAKMRRKIPKYSNWKKYRRKSKKYLVMLTFVSSIVLKKKREMSIIHIRMIHKKRCTQITTNHV